MMDYTKLFSGIANKIRELVGIPQQLSSIHKAIQDQAETEHQASERTDQQQEIRQKWLDKIFTEYEQTKGNRATNQQDQYGVQNSLRWAAWLTFVAAAIYGTLTFFLWLNARQQLEMEQRSWLVFDTNYSDTLVLGAERDPILVPFRLVNIGKTPARAVDGFVVIEELKEGEHPNFADPKDRAVPIRVGMLYPGSEYAQTTLIGEFADGHNAVLVTELKRKQFVGGKLFFNVWGRLQYMDVFRQPHWVQFCHAIAQNPSGKTKECVNHNLVDTPNIWASLKAIFRR